MEILGRERRRRWTQTEKLEIVTSVGVNGETLAHVARRYDVSRGQIYHWRRAFEKRGLLSAPVGPAFLPVDIGAPMLNVEPTLEERMVSASMVELCLAQGRRLCFDRNIESASLIRLIRSVEAA